MTLIFADVDDVPMWMESAPENAEHLLEEASVLVAHTSRFAVYDTTLDGFPRNSVLRTAMREATASQAAFWARSGLDPSDGVIGAKPLVTSQSVAGGSVSYAAMTIEDLETALNTLCPAAKRRLDLAGLTDGTVVRL